MLQNLKNIKDGIPDYVFEVADKLIQEGYEAYLVGGSIRDIIMGRTPKDYDIGTNALPNKVIEMFKRAVGTGAEFGAVKVLEDDEYGETFEVDVTTYRVEEEYVHGRWPTDVVFTGKIEKDLARRDFTWNAMALDFQKLLEDEIKVLDPYNGIEDLQSRIVKAVGDPEERLKEDALRALRACRFASVLQFTVEKNLLNAVSSVLTTIDNLSPERVRDEFLKILYDSPKPSIGLELLRKTGILEIWIPELLEGEGVTQPEYHTYDVYKHALRAVDTAEDRVKLAALFHDIGKSRTESKEGDKTHFYRHDIVSAEMTEEILKRLHFPKKQINYVTTLIRWHMFYFPYDEEDIIAGEDISEEKLKENRDIDKWSDATIRRFVKNVGGEDAIDDLFRLRIADATANPKSSFDAGEIQALQKRIAEVRSQDMALKISDLDINGRDLIELGIEPSPQMGKILNELLDMVVEDPKLNDKETLIKIVKEKFKYEN